MVDYRKTIYANYHRNHVNKAAVDHKALLAQQQLYYFKEMVPHLPSNTSAHIVDIGCGFGSMVAAAKQAGYTQFKGIDLSPDQVEVAHELGLKEVKLQSSDAFFESGQTLDCIVGIDIIEHYTKDELIRFLTQCLAHLKPGGTVLFRTPNMDSPQASVFAHADISHETFLNKSSAIQLMNSTGFVDVEVLPSMIWNQKPLREFMRRLMWFCVRLQKKIELFASGRTWDQVVFSPNIIIKARKA